jgi:hypothetical protein
VALYCGGARCIARYEKSNASTTCIQGELSTGLLFGDVECPHHREVT